MPDTTGGFARPCSCGPDEMCFECATDDQLAAAIPDWRDTPYPLLAPDRDADA